MTTERTPALGGDFPQGNEHKASPARDEGERTNEGGYGTHPCFDEHQPGCGCPDPVYPPALSPAQTGGTAVAWRDMADEPYALTLLYTTAPDSDGMERVFLALAHSPETAEAVGWQYLPGDRLAAPVAEGAREAVRAAIRGTQLRNPLLGIYTVGGAINADILSDIEDAILQALDTGTSRGGG